MDKIGVISFTKDMGLCILTDKRSQFITAVHHNSGEIL